MPADSRSDTALKLTLCTYMSHTFPGAHWSTMHSNALMHWQFYGRRIDGSKCGKAAAKPKTILWSKKI